MTRTMKKKFYQAPCIKTVELIENCGILAASGDEPKIQIDKTQTISTGFVDAKEFSNKGLWDDDDED